MKTKRTSQYANEHGLPLLDSARFEHGGVSTQHEGRVCGPGLAKTLPTDIASPCSLFSRTEAGSCVSVPHAYFSCTHMYVYSMHMYSHECVRVVIRYELCTYALW